MSKVSDFLGVIPARGGSKEIPRKNIKKIAGKPLINWSIDSASKSKLLSNIVVSSDDPEILAISKEKGIDILERPSHLAQDESSMVSVLKNVLENFNAKNIVLLQPTSPIRDSDLIDKSISIYKENKTDNLVTGYICKIMEYGTYTDRRQDLDGFFYNDGNISIINSDLIMSNTLIGENPYKYIIDRWQNVEIDDNFDFWLAEQILIRRIKNGIYDKSN